MVEFSLHKHPLGVSVPPTPFGVILELYHNEWAKVYIRGHELTMK